MSKPPEAPLKTRPPICSSFWIDESYNHMPDGSACIVMGGIKTRVADDLQRAIRAIRDKHRHHNSELKFTKIGAGNFPIFRDIVDLLAEDSDARIIAAVSDLGANNPFRGKHEWRSHTEMAAKLIVGNTNKGEIGVAYLDLLNTPPGKSLGYAVKRKVNTKVGGQVLVDAVSLDSKCTDLLQVADAISGAIRYEREGSTGNEYKTKFVRRLAAAFNLENLEDVRNERVNILTLRDRKTLKLVQNVSSAS